MARQNVTATKSSDHHPKAEKKIRPQQKLRQLTEPPHLDNSDGSESENDEGSGVDEEGLEKLVRALGKDGLDEFDLTQLRMLVGSPVDEEEDGEEGDDDVDHHAESTTGSEEEKQADGEGAEDGIALDDEDIDSVDEDAIPRRKIEVDNKIALERIRDTIKLDSSLPWTETLAVSFPETIDVDIDDDLNRELAFYKQALHGAKTARALAAEHRLPFTRPDDFFAEMVKTDAHMERIRQRLLDENASIAKSDARRRERESKKVGKQVQIEKLKERQRSKKDMEERLKGLKRKHKGAMQNAQADGDDDAFDVAVEDAITDRPAKRARTGKAGGGLPRHARDQKFGFGGRGKRDKQNTRTSTDDFDRSVVRRGMSGGARGRGGKGQTRPGKSRRATARSKK